MVNQDYTDLVAIKQQADDFFAALSGLVQSKNTRIAALEGKLRDALAVINNIVDIKSDFALLKDKTTNDAKNLAQDIKDTLGD